MILKTVSIGIGRSGAIVTSHDGFQSLVHSEQVLTPGQSYPDPTLESECSIGNYSPYAPDHDPNMFRGIAFGNNKFVAVGGCCHANSRTSVDGVSWATEVKVDKTTVTYGGCPWAGDVTFGEGVFASLGGGVSMWSTDGENWQRITWAGGNRPSGSYRRMEFENGVFIGVGSSGAPLVRSLNGTNWEVDSSVTTGTIIAAGKGLFLINDLTDAKKLKVFNTNTLTWADGNIFLEDISSLYFDYQNEVFYARAGNVQYSSTDGLIWMNMGSSNYSIDGYANGVFYSFRRSWGTTASSSRYTSIDGLQWQLAENKELFNPIIDYITRDVEVEE
jgi:hypothetical protein